MASYKELFHEKKNQNWLKASVAVDITKNGLIPFVMNIVTLMHQAIRANVDKTNKLSPGATCNSCQTPNVLKCRTKGVCAGKTCKFHQHLPFGNCPTNICNDFKKGIEDHHRFKGPSWKNTNASDWCTNPWEVAKCFYPPDGYFNVKTAADTDINGIISLIINCTFFDNYLTDDLTKKTNVCTQVREVGKGLRHSPSLMLTDDELSNCINALKRLLQDNKYLASDQKAKDALVKLTLLENDQLRVSTDDLANVISNAISTTREMLNTENNLQEKMQELKALQQHFQTVADEVVQRIAKARQEYDLEHYSSKSAALKQDLQNHYLESCSALDLGPMFEMKSPNLVDVYIPPKLSKSTVIKCPYNKIVHFEITKLDEVFRNTGYKAKHIYITAKAGVGKSTFCKFIVRLWCAFQRNDKDAIKSLKSRGAGAYLNNCDELKNVQYVFYARLSQSRSILCEMDEIVFEQVIRRLSMSENYDKKFLQAVLGKERCLVIFDSLDEWCHPDVMNTRCFAEDKESPHERNREKCTVMIASRHWKLGLPKMHSKKSNLCVEIEELDGTNIQSLVKQAFTLVVGDSEQTKPIEELFRWIDQKGLDHLLGSTLVVWQLLFLWHEGHLLGESKCQVYCNVLEMMFTKVLKQYSRVQHFAAVDHPQPDTIKCLQTRTHCMMFQEYIRNLGKMAFYSLFDVETLDDQMESNLPKSLGTSHKEELGLLAGLLSKTQVHASSVNPRYEYSFLHKTYHEMLACVYIASVSYNSEEHERIVETIKNSGQTFSLDMMQFICGMHETWSKEMFEIYCDMPTTMLCRGSYIELPAVKVFHKNCLNIIKEFGANKTATMKMRSLLLDSTYNYGSKISTKEFGEISFMALKVKKHKQRDMFDGVQDIVGHCKIKLNYLSIKNYDVDNAIPCPIASKTMQSCINLHTLILRNLTIVGELDLTGCSLLSILDLSLPKEGEHVRLIISPKRLRQCSISIDDFVVSYTINIKCTCPFNSELLEGLFLWNVKLEDNLRLLDCEQLQVLALINVNTRNITTCFEYGKLIFCCLGGFTYPAAMKGALQSLQYSQNLNFLSIWYLNDSITTSLNKTLSSLENIEEIQLFFSESIIRDLQIPVSVKTLSASAIFISADCLIKLINTFKASHAEVDFDLGECFVSPCDEVTIENIVREIKQCNQCVLNEASFPCEDEMEEESVFGFKMNVRKLDFKITRGRQDE